MPRLGTSICACASAMACEAGGGAGAGALAGVRASHFSLSCIGEGNGNPLQCSCLENPRDGGAWWAAVSGVAQSRTRLKRHSSSSSSRYIPSSGVAGSGGCCSVTQLCPDPVDSSTPGLPVPQHLPKFGKFKSNAYNPAISSSDTLFLKPSIFPSIRDFSNESAAHIR